MVTTSWLFRYHNLEGGLRDEGELAEVQVKRGSAHDHRRAQLWSDEVLVQRGQHIAEEGLKSRWFESQIVHWHRHGCQWRCSLRVGRQIR